MVTNLSSSFKENLDALLKCLALDRPTDPYAWMSKKLLVLAQSAKTGETKEGAVKMGATEEENSIVTNIQIKVLRFD